jgi:hypothetical protein
VTAHLVTGFAIDSMSTAWKSSLYRRLPRDAQDRDRIGLRRIEAGDHVGSRGPGGADAHADVAGRRARIALGHVRCTFDVAREDVRDAAARLHRRVQRVDRSAGDAERVGHTFALQHVHGGVDGSHLGHGVSPRETGMIP